MLNSDSDSLSLNSYPGLIDFINCWLEFQSKVDKIYQPLIEIYQPLIFFINGMLFDNYLLTVLVVNQTSELVYTWPYIENIRTIIHRTLWYYSKNLNDLIGYYCMFVFSMYYIPVNTKQFWTFICCHSNNRS